MEWQAISTPASTPPTQPFSRSDESPGRGTWLLSTPGSDPQVMRVHASPTDPAGAAIASLEKLQVALGGLQLPPAQFVGGRAGRSTLQLTTSGAVAVLGAEPAPVATSFSAARQASSAVLVGLGKVIAAEMPSLACVAADHDVRAASSALGRRHRFLHQAAVAFGPDAHGAALHGGVRLAPRLLPAVSGASAGQSRPTMVADSVHPSQGAHLLSETGWLRID